MELKPGYKLTEVGVIPEDWELKEASDLGVIRTGPFGTILQADEYSSEGGMPLISVGEIRDGYIKILETTPRISPKTAKRIPQFVLQAGDIVFARKGSVDRSAIVPEQDAPYFLGSDGISFRANKSMDSLFSSHYYRTNVVKNWIFQNTTGTTMLSLNQKIIGTIPVPVPPLAEQQAIAAALSDVDALVEGLESLLAKKRDLKQAAMQQLLTGKTRLPGFGGEWEFKKVSEMGAVIPGKALNSKGAGKMKPYLRTKNVLDGKISIDDVLQMPFSDADFEKFSVHFGDVLLNEGQSLELVGRCAMYRGELDQPCAIQNQLILFRSNKQTAAFAEHLFRFCQLSGIFAGIATQTTSVAHLGTSRFAKLQLWWPKERSEQQAIAAVLSDMDAEIEALEARLEKTRALKQGMMQDLLTGRVRLPHPPAPSPGR